MKLGMWSFVRRDTEYKYAYKFSKTVDCMQELQKGDGAIFEVMSDSFKTDKIYA